MTHIAKDDNQVPAIGVYVPGIGVVAARGTSLQTDTDGTQSATLQSDANFSGNITVNGSGGGGGGGSSDIALHDFTTTSQHLAIDSTGKVGINNFPTTQPVSGTVTSNIQAGGVALGLDNTNELKTSIYVKTTAAGDTPLTVGQTTMAASIPVTLASNQTAIPISGSITATNPSVSGNSANIPTSSTMIGASDGTLLKPLLVDGSGNLKVVSSGGGSSDIALHDFTTTSQHLAIDSTGKIGINNFPTTQPVSGIINVADAVTPANKLVVNASGQIGINNFPTTQPVSGTVAVSNFPGTQPVSGTVTSNIQVGGVAPGLDNTNELKTSLYVKTTAAGDTALAVGQATMAASLPVTIASNQAAIPVSGTVATTSSSVGGNNATQPTSSTSIGASDGTNLQQLLVESSANRNLRIALFQGANEANVTGANALKVDGSAVTQPVSGTVAVSGVPANASTNLTQINGAAISNANPLPTSPQGTSTSNIQVGGVAPGLDNTNELKTSLYVKTTTAGDTALAVGQGTMAASLPVTIASNQSAIPISGSITATNPSVGTTATAVPGSATYIGANKSGNIVGLALDTSGNLNVNVQAGGTGSNASVSGNSSAIPASSTMIGASDGTLLKPLLVDGSGNLKVVSSGAASSNISQIGGTALNLGQASMASSIPVTLASNQPALAISGSITANNASVSGNSANIPTSSTLIAASDGTLLKPLLVDGSGNLKVVSSGGGSSDIALHDFTTTSQHLAIDSTGKVGINNFPTTQPVSGTVTVNAGTGNFTNASVGTDGSAIPASSTMIGASDGTNLQQLLVESTANKNLRVGLFQGANEANVTGANALKVDGSAVTQPVSGTVTSNIQVGGVAPGLDNTNELKTSLYVKTTTAGDTALTVGQTTMAASLPVTIASNQAAIPISGSITATNPSVGTTATAVPGSATYIGANKSGNIVGLALDTSGNLNVNVQAGGVGSNSSVGGNNTTQPTSSTLIGATDGTNIQNLLVESAANKNLRTGIFSGTYEATVFPTGSLRTTNEPSQIFVDPFDAALDTTNVWKTPVSSGGGVAASVTAGILTLGSGTTANGYSYLESIPTFKPTVPGFIGYAFVVKIESAVTLNAHRFWGAGTSPGTPTSSAPITDGIGFELTTAGKLFAVVYAAGTRTAVQDLSSATGNSTQPADNAYHRYTIYTRADKIIWTIDTLDAVVATANFVAPTVQTLPLKLACEASGTAPGSSCVITCNELAVWDTGHNNAAISDGVYPWRKAQVSTAGALKIDGTGNSINIGNHHFDAAGNLLTSSFSPMYATNTGGPPLANGSPSGLGFDIVKTLQGKNANGPATITTTVVGDTSLVFASAPVALAPGTVAYLTGGANPIECVYVTTTFAPGTGVVTVPLASPVRFAGHTSVYYDSYAALGPQFGGMSMNGILPTAMSYWNPGNSPVNQHELVRGNNGFMANQPYIDYLINQGASYTSTTNLVSSSSTGLYAASLYSGTGKNIWVYSILVSMTTSGSAQLYQATTNPAYANTATVANSNVANSAGTATMTWATTATTIPGSGVTVLNAVPFASSGNGVVALDLLVGHRKIFIPGYTTKALTCYMTTGAATSTWSVTYSWLEY